MTQTSVTRRLGIEHPVIGAPIGGLSVPARADGGEIVRYRSTGAARATVTDRIDRLSLWADRSAGLVHDVLPAAEIVRRTVTDAEAILGREDR